MYTSPALPRTRRSLLRRFLVRVLRRHTRGKCPCGFAGKFPFWLRKTLPPLTLAGSRPAASSKAAASRLDRAALAAVRRWRFRGGPGVVVVPFEFVLR